MEAYVLHTLADQLVASRLIHGLLGREVVAEGGASLSESNLADAVIVVWSPAAIADRSVVRIARRARSAGRLLQVKAKACDVPRYFGEIDGVALDGWSGDQADVYFQRILAGVRRLVEGVGPKSAKPPSGLGWKDRTGRQSALWTIATITAVAGVASVWFNLESAKDRVCKTSGAYQACRRLNLVGPPPADIVSRISGDWSADNCETVGVQLAPTPDGGYIELEFEGQKTRARIGPKGPNEVALVYYPQPSGREDWRLELAGDQLVMWRLDGNAWSDTRLKRCAD